MVPSSQFFGLRGVPAGCEARARWSGILFVCCHPTHETPMKRDETPINAVKRDETFECFNCKGTEFGNAYMSRVAAFFVSWG